MAGRARGAAVGPVLGAHRGRPARGISVALGQAGILEDPAKDAGHVLVQTGEWRVVRHAPPQNLAHGGGSSPSRESACATPVPRSPPCQLGDPPPNKSYPKGSGCLQTRGTQPTTGNGAPC